MIDNKYFILFLVVILLGLILFNYKLMVEKESFDNFEETDNDSDLSDNINIVSEEIEDKVDKIFAIDLNQDNVSNVKQAFNQNPDKFMSKLDPNEIIANNSFINNQIKDAIKKEKETAELIINNRNTNGNLENDETISSEDLSGEKDSQDLKTMFEQLENMEYLCTNLERKNKLKDNLEQIRINEVAMKELKEQENQINELMGIVKQLRLEQQKRETITGDCRGKSQQKLNADYNLVKDLSKKGLLKNEAINVNLDMGIEKKLDSIIKNGGVKGKTAQAITNDLFNFAGTSGKKPIATKCGSCNINKNKYIHKDKLKNGVCMGCDVSKILKKDNNPALVSREAQMGQHF